MSGRPRKPEVDERIVRAAREVLADGGLEGFTLAAVARRAGVGRPTIYRRHANTTELLMAVLYADLAEVWAELERGGLQCEDPLEFVVTVGTRLFRYYARDAAVSRAMLQATLFAEPPWRDRFGVQALAFLAWMAGELARCQEAGRLDPALDVELVAHTFFGVYVPLAVAGTNGAMPLEQQEAMLRAVMAQHLRVDLTR